MTGTSRVNRAAAMALVPLIAWGAAIGIAGISQAQAQAQAQAVSTGKTNNTRETIRVLSSPLQVKFVRAISDAMTRRQGTPALDIASMLATPAVAAFCSGIGPDTPDVIGIPRRMARREVERCEENGVIDIIELAMGYDALVIVARKGDTVFNITPRAMYYALAAEIPEGDDTFIRNDVKLWRQIDPRLPDLEINVLGSENGTAINQFFKDIFMEGGCRGLRQFKLFMYAADERVKACTTMREDGRFTPIKPPIAINFRDKMKKAPPGAIGVLPYTVYLQNRDWLDMMPVAGVIATDRTIKDDDYEAVFPVRFYVKRAHMDPRYGGRGVVRGLYDFIREAMSEEAIGRGGYLEAQGLVVDDDEDRAKDREEAMRLQRFKR